MTKRADTQLAPQNHVAYIDGLRAVAVLMVVGFHGTIHDPHLARTWWIPAGFVGAHGVELFFVISGLCLSGTYLRRHERTGGLGFDGPAFFAKRLLRILPPYYVSIALFAVLATLLPLWRAANDSPAGGAMVDHVTMNMLLAHLLFVERDRQALNASFWTLRIEAVWYLLFPLILFVYARSVRLFWAIAIICAISALFTAFGPAIRVAGTFFVLTTSMPAFMLGIVAADPRTERALSVPVLWGVFIVSTLAGVVGDYVYGSRVIWGISAFAFVLLARRVLWLRGAMAWRPLGSIGVISFSIYLVHEPVVAMLEYLDVPFFLIALCVLAAGYGFWFLVERPITKDPMRRRLVQRVGSVLRLVTAQRARPAIE